MVVYSRSARILITTALVALGVAVLAFLGYKFLQEGPFQSALLMIAAIAAMVAALAGFTLIVSSDFAKN